MLKVGATIHVWGGGYDFAGTIIELYDDTAKVQSNGTGTTYSDIPVSYIHSPEDCYERHGSKVTFKEQ